MRHKERERELSSAQLSKDKTKKKHILNAFNKTGKQYLNVQYFYSISLSSVSSCPVILILCYVMHCSLFCCSFHTFKLSHFTELNINNNNNKKIQSPMDSFVSFINISFEETDCIGYFTFIQFFFLRSFLFNMIGVQVIILKMFNTPIQDPSESLLEGWYSREILNKEEEKN